MVDGSSTKNEEDYLQLENEKEVRKYIRDEKVIFSNKINKINHYGFNQERTILITNKAIYNLKKKSMKRRIDYAFVRGITVSKLNDEFVIHCRDDQHDYYYISSKKKKIIEHIGNAYNKETNLDFKICELEAKSLKNVVTSKKEKKKDISFSKMPETNLMTINTYLWGLKQEHIQLTKKASIIQRSNTIFSRKKDVKEVKIEDFKKIKVIGRGSFGKVYLVEYIPTNEVFAMKSLKKDVLIDQDQIENTLLEKRILQTLDHNFLVGLVFCFQTVERVYFVMPFLRGGELFIHLRKQKTFDEDRVRFYGAQISLALDNLHSYGIVYRDLKPENILMDDEGYLKIADFGMAKHLKEGEKTMSFCGTPEYLAPEIITGDGHNKSCDWWSFGILLYEMLCGIPPFYNENVDRMYELIKLSELRFPKKIKISAEAQEIISKFLDRNPSTRLGSKDGLRDFKTHAFFSKIDFDKVLQKQIIPTFKPEISGNADVRNFDEDFLAEPVEQTYIPDSNLDVIKKNNDRFKDF